LFLVLISNIIELIQEYNLQELVTIGTGFSIEVLDSIYENFLDKKFKSNDSNNKPSKMSYAITTGILTGLNKNPHSGFGSDWDRAVGSGVLGTISYGIGFQVTNKIIRNISNNYGLEK
jgi:hypothetical protein